MSLDDKEWFSPYDKILMRSLDQALAEGIAPAGCCTYCGQPNLRTWIMCGRCAEPQSGWIPIDPTLEALYRVGGRRAVLQALQEPPYREILPPRHDVGPPFSLR